jgi:8-oxo-dGTP pyrophosphatase MutT (NUDIX family)
MNPHDVQIHCCFTAVSLTAREAYTLTLVRYERPTERSGRGEPASGGEPNTGEVSAARQAASVILLRDGHGGMEVLLVQRNPEQRFMGGAWVFPGGAVSRDGSENHAQAALRELEEEAGVRLADEAMLVPYSRWITPAEVKTRFDTWFFAAPAPPGIEPTPDGQETVDARWLTPQDALDAFARGDLTLVFPTIKHLEQLCELDSTAATLEAARAWEVRPVQPRVVVEGESARVLLPGDPGYDG